MPLHLYEKFRTSLTVPSGVYLRRMSSAMSEKSRCSSVGCQIGPSVNVKPPATRSALDPSATRSKIASDLASIPRPASVLVICRRLPESWRDSSTRAASGSSELLDAIADRDPTGLDDLAPDAEGQRLGRLDVGSILRDHVQGLEIGH